MEMLLFPLALAALLLWGIRLDSTTPPLNQESTLAIRGVCAVEIMLGHLGLATGSFALYPNRKVGILIVGVFLALSGYGLRYSMEKKPNYIRHFLPRRLLKILLPAYIVYLFSCALQNLPGMTGHFSFRSLVDPFVFFFQTNWYVWELGLFYILFYLAYRFLPSLLARRTLFFCSVFLIFVFWLGHWEKTWYGSTLCFWAGIWFHDHQELFRRGERSRFYLSLLAGLTLTAVSILAFFLLGEDSFLGGVLGRNVASLTFTMVYIFACHRIQFGNPLSLWLGRYSYEIFLLHFVYIDLFSSYILHPFFLCAAVFAATLFSALGLNTLLGRIVGVRKRPAAP